MQMNGTIGRRVKPIARPTAFDYNVCVDLAHMHDQKKKDANGYYPCATEKASHRIMEGEIVVRITDNEAKYTDKRARVTSMLNGLQIDGIEDRVHYMGVAITGHDTHKDPMEQGFPVSVGGLFTLINSGDEEIHAGRVIACGFSSDGPHNRTMGVPEEKILVKTVRWKPGIPRRFIIGKAVSGASPGKPFDICLATGVETVDDMLGFTEILKLVKSKVDATSDADEKTKAQEWLKKFTADVTQLASEKNITKTQAYKEIMAKRGLQVKSPDDDQETELQNEFSVYF